MLHLLFVTQESSEILHLVLEYSTISTAIEGLVVYFSDLDISKYDWINYPRLIEI